MIISRIVIITYKNIIYQEIEKKTNKKIIKLKKLYQATLDGGDPINFHLNCDNIPNTLILIRSEGLRKFGGFTPIPWKSDENGILIQDQEGKRGRQEEGRSRKVQEDQPLPPVVQEKVGT